MQLFALNKRNIKDIYHSDALTHYLSTVLIGDELAKEVRAEFDAYIFLSYRKKDKEYARKLMRIIHENDICRDVAIWYDEYLIAGENFNNGIEEAIKKCDIFTMAVTPNLVNEENYVMTTEYPIAAREEKTILPVELEKTDPYELREKYKGIPDCIDAKNGQMMSDALSHLFTSYIINERKSEPRHFLLIGLAYMNGIDVEVNKKRGIELITFAAEAGLPEAMNRLANIYKHGDGTKIDHRMAWEWLRRLALAVGKEYYAHPEKGYDKYVDSLFSFAMESNLYLGDLKNALEAYQQIVQVITEKDSITNRKYSILPVIYLELGDIYLNAGELQTAYKYNNNTRMEIENNPVYNDPSDMLMQSRLQLIYQNLGYIAQKYRKYSESWEYLHKSFVIAKAIVDQSGEMEARVALAGVYSHLRTNCEFRGDLSNAYKYFMESVSVCKNITAEMDDCWLSLANAYGKLGEICVYESNFTQAEEYYRESMAICDKFKIETDGAIEEKELIAGICLRFGALLKFCGKNQAAEHYLNRSLSIHKEFWENSQRWFSGDALVRIYYELGSLGEGNIQYLDLSFEMWKEIMYEMLSDMEMRSENWKILKEKARLGVKILTDGRIIKLRCKKAKFISSIKGR